jgi:hypothetical protein
MILLDILKNIIKMIIIFGVNIQILKILQFMILNFMTKIKNVIINMEQLLFGQDLIQEKIIGYMAFIMVVAIQN